MSVILKFTIEDEAFQLGRALSPPPDMQIELERIIPTGGMVMPFLWVTGGETDAFEEKVRTHSAVRGFRALDHIDNSVLYRIEWENQPSELLTAIADSDAVLLEARGNNPWMFRLRFADHEKLSQFHNYIIEHEIPIHIKRTYTLSEMTAHGHRFGLTTDQREALILALRRGYFASPREVNLDDLADELGISRQAVSTRLRRGNESVLRTALLSSASDTG